MECHKEIHSAWSGTDHALANRLVDSEGDAEAFAHFPVRDAVGSPVAILGNKPLWQPLIAKDGGRLQPHELAYDPAKHEWFNVFGGENRRPGEWGHWTGRGMNWNSMCAHCHMTDFEKRYDPVQDAYSSTWLEQGIGCVQCHGHVSREHTAPGYKRNRPLGDPQARALAMQTCAPCHARNEPLTESFKPGDSYADHYRVVLPVDPAVFYPDGQQRDEVFNWTSVLLSRMGHAGVTCMDCHDPHSTRTVLPVANNALCMQCHAAPGRVQPSGIQAPAIEPLAHSHHKEGSAGNLCVECHMPRTTYMQRAPRHDHGWLSPDPLLTRELGIPNACSTCHADKGLDWTFEAADRMFGSKARDRQRERARALTAAQVGQPGAGSRLIALLAREDIPTWRATYLSLLAELEEPTLAREPALRAVQSVDANERAAAVRLLAQQPDGAALIRPHLQDSARLVRLDAALALSGQPNPASSDRAELDAYLSIALDQPSGRVRLAFDMANRGNSSDALTQVEKALEWDRQSAGMHEAKAALLTSLGRLAEAARSYLDAAELSPMGAGSLAMRAGLAYAEAGRLADAERALRFAVQNEPQFHRAAYNLGLLLAQANRLDEAASFLALAEQGGSRVAEYPYALATVKLRQRDQAGALAAAKRTLAIDPQHAGARQILEHLSTR